MFNKIILIFVLSISSCYASDSCNKKYIDNLISYYQKLIDDENTKPIKRQLYIQEIENLRIQKFICKNN